MVPGTRGNFEKAEEKGKLVPLLVVTFPQVIVTFGCRWYHSWIYWWSSEVKEHAQGQRVNERNTHGSAQGCLTRKPMIPLKEFSESYWSRHCVNSAKTQAYGSKGPCKKSQWSHNSDLPERSSPAVSKALHGKIRAFYSTWPSIVMIMTPPAFTGETRCQSRCMAKHMTKTTQRPAPASSHSVQSRATEGAPEGEPIYSLSSPAHFFLSPLLRPRSSSGAWVSSHPHKQTPCHRQTWGGISQIHSTIREQEISFSRH